jgi:hypothetical protein
MINARKVHREVREWINISELQAYCSMSIESQNV